MSESEVRSARVLELAEEFLQRYRQGQRPKLQEYTLAHPDLADEIRDVFPAMAMLENIAIDETTAVADQTDGPGEPPVAHLKQLGDFRVIREIGHGGMGVVYEAEQVSLGRHVALKVLPRQMVRDVKQLKRFQREAKAAARLHHTNIVPVFGVGEEDGTAYYVMQFIQGLGLDEVIEELKRLQRPGEAGRSTTPAEPLRVTRRDTTAALVAQSLLTGRLGADGTEASVPPESSPLAPDPTIAGAMPAITAAGSPGSSSAAPHEVPGGGRLSGSFSLSSSSAVLPGGSKDGRSARSRAPSFWKSVAQLGIQVADALEYAHKQGVLHRDIKPSNLLLDTCGTVWVTDFGLAKADDLQNLTHTGDILGTLRYMPPEAFDGKSDPRGDVYSLGATLYEMLAFRPAFPEKERNKLIKQVTSEEPPRLGKLNPEIPRDLETIVHKATEREPLRRYATAAELAQDLERFLHDEPILARRVTLAERYVSWARRNPVIAALGAILTAVLVMVAVASFLTARRLAILAQEQTLAAWSERDARLAAEHERQLADRARGAAVAAFREADAQRKRAEENFQQARRAVDLYFTQVSESQLLSVPGLQTLRSDLLRSALTFYGDFVQRRSQDPDLRSTLAAVHLKAAKIHAELGRPDDSRNDYLKALALYEALCRLDPADVALARGLAEAHLGVGGHDVAGRSRTADLQRSVAIRQRLAAGSPADGSLREELARSYQALGDRQLVETQVGDAIKSYLSARDIVATLVRDHPDCAPYQDAFARNLGRIADCLCRLGRHQDETIVRPLAIEHATTAHELMPQLVPYARLSGQLYGSDAANFAFQGRLIESERAARQAIEVQLKLLRENPAVPDLSEDLVLSCSRLTIVLRRLRRPSEAVQVLRDVRASVESAAPQGPHLLFAVARLWALSSETMDPALPSERDLVRRRRDADFAVAALRRSLAAGFHQSDAIEASLPLASLRARDDFKALLAGLKGSAAAGPPAGRSHDLPPDERLGTPAPAQPRRPLVDLSRYQADLASSQHAIALIQLALGDRAAALRSFQLVTELRLALAESKPGKAESRTGPTQPWLEFGTIEWENGRLAEGARDWARGVDLLTKSPDSGTVSESDESSLGEACRRIGFAFGTLGMWDEAGHYYARVPRGLRVQTGRSPGYEQALMLLLASDEGGYRRLAQRLSRQPVDQLDALETLHIDTLATRQTHGPSELLALAAKAKGAQPADSDLSALLVQSALYRAGLLDRAARARPELSPDRFPEYLVLQALIAQARGLPGEALDWLRQADRWYQGFMERVLAAPPHARLPITPWQHFAHFQVWRREAQALMKAPPVLGDSLFRLHRARVYHRLEEPEQAESEFQAALALRPADPLAWLARAAVFDQLGLRDRSAADLARAEDLILSLIRERPDDRELLSIAAGLYHRRARMLRRWDGNDRSPRALTDDSRSRAYYERLLKLDPESAADAAGLASVLFATDLPPAWRVLQPRELISAGGATLTVKPDGSILASGQNPAQDTYTITADSDLSGITAFRLELIPDPSLPFGSSGRAPENGNLTLTEWKVTAQSIRAPSDPVVVRWKTARSDHHVEAAHHYAGVSTTIGQAIDADPKTYWEPWPKTEQPHWAIFVLREPLGGEGSVRLTITLDCRSRYSHHNIGRFRLSITTEPDIDALARLAGPGVPARNGWSLLGAAYARRREWRPALDALRQAESPVARGAVGDLLLQALVLDQLGEADRARQLVDRAWSLMQAQPLGAGHPLLSAATATARRQAALAEARRIIERLAEEAAFDLALDPRSREPTTSDLAEQGAFQARAELYARQGQWELAKADMTRAMQLNENAYAPANLLGLLYVKSGDLAGYRRFSRALIDRALRSQPSPVLCLNFATASTFAPDALSDYSQALVLVERGAEAFQESKTSRLDYLLARAGVLCRAGRFQEALDLLNERKSELAADGEPQDWAFLAIVHQHLGHFAQAQHWLKRLRARKPDEGQEDFWDALALEIFQTEAEALVMYDPVFPADPFAP
jgi:serine/threonine protein kinase/tetratricopeptide (TPR) repeat protein